MTIQPSATPTSSTVFLVLRRMRTPLVLLIGIYAVCVLGLMLIPGVDAEGRAAPGLSFFHAFYVISYTATTIGFGELPLPFSDAQRLWVTTCIYLTVVGWSYAVVNILTLLQEKAFRAAVAANRFTRRVRRLTEPFYLVCGAGATGTTVVRSLAGLGLQCVIIERDELRVQELELEDLATDPPMLTADAAQPDTLLRAGMLHPQCQGVVALTDDEQANLAVAIAARLLNPEYPVIARTTHDVVAANMASFGTDHIINPFEKFAAELALSIAAPDHYRLTELLTGLPGDELPEPHRPPRGRWIVSGYGRFGRAVVREFTRLGITVTVIEPQTRARHDELPDGVRFVAGRGTERAVLLAAGADTASGVVAASDSDVDNLSTAITARETHPGIFIVTRQNQAANAALFTAFEHDFAMVPSDIVATECVALLTTPLLNQFVVQIPAFDEAWCADLAARLEQAGHQRVPRYWDVALDAAHAPAVVDALGQGRVVTLGDLTRDPSDRSSSLDLVMLMWHHGEDRVVLPGPDVVLAPGDRLLVAGRSAAQRRLRTTLQNANALEYLLTGSEHSGWLWRSLSRSARPR